MELLRWVCVSMSVCAVIGAVSVKREGWLDRAVAFYRSSFLNDVQETAPVQIRVSLQKVPEGAPPDPEGVWDYPAVERLLTLLGASEDAAPIRRALRRALRPSPLTRRFISKKESFNLFPSLGQKHANNIYYDFESEETDSDEDKVKLPWQFDFTDNAVLVLENPVEARLPSARITVKLLRDILESRALAARQMPSTQKSTIPWVPMNTSIAPSGGGKGNGTGDDKSDAAPNEEGGAAAEGEAEPNAEPEANAEGEEEPEAEAPAEGGERRHINRAGQTAAHKHKPTRSRGRAKNTKNLP